MGTRPTVKRRATPVVQAFESEVILVPISAILPVKTLRATVKASHKYQQIVASIREIGLVEPPVVARDPQSPGTYLLLDGHLRVEALKDLEQTKVECLVSTDDEAFTYNRRISRLAAVQQRNMILKAIERGVPKDRLARALDINVFSLERKVRMLDGICDEAVELLKDKPTSMALFEHLQKLKPLRQIEAAELMINANNFSVAYGVAIVAGTPQSQLADDGKPKRLKGVTPEVIARMERELARVQEQITSIEDTYGKDHLHLTVMRGYLGKLLGNGRVVRYLAQQQPDFLSEFQAIAEMATTLPSEAA